MIVHKSIGVAIVLSIVTCGIYGLYWWCQITNSVAFASNDQKMSGGKVIGLSIITCNIYGIYWAYRMGKDLEIAQQRRNMPSSDSSVLYLILQLIGLSIVNFALMQNELNQMS